MKRILSVLLALVAIEGISFAQASGNVGYSQTGGKTKAEQNERSKRTQVEVFPTPNSMFIDASVLMNVKADEYVAVFAISQECATVAECNQIMDATVNGFSAELKRLGVGTQDIFVDFAAQNKIYGYQVTGNIAKERLAGFELKKKSEATCLAVLFAPPKALTDGGCGMIEEKKKSSHSALLAR